MIFKLGVPMLSLRAADSAIACTCYGLPGATRNTVQPSACTGFHHGARRLKW
jgi:hypothetical protein